MANEFDPDAYLARPQAQPEFDPDAYLKTPRERGVLERAGSAVADTFMGGVEAAKKAFTPPSKEEAAKHLGPSGAWQSFKETGEALLSPFTTTIGAGMAAPQSLIASGMAGITPGKETSEQKYEEWYPKIGTALTAVMPGRGRPPKPATGPEADAARYIEQEATDPAKVKTDLATAQREIVPGSTPTTYQLTKDPGLAALERSAETRNTQEFRVLREQQNAARLKALEDVQATGSPQDVADHLREALRVEEQGAEAALVAARQRAWEASQQAGGTYDATTYGNIFRRELQIAEDTTRANERRLWQAVDPNGELRVNPQRLQETERGIYGNLSDAAVASLTPAENTLIRLIQNYRPVTPFREMTDLRSLTSTSLREELYTRGRTPAYARLSRLRQGIEEAVNNSFTEEGTGAAGAAERLRAASTATRERAQQFQPMRDITRREGVEGPYRMGESAVPGRIVQPGPKGYDSASNYLRAVGNERGLPELQDAIAASMRREVIGTDGVVNQRKLEGWMRRHQDVLRAIDERDGGGFSQRLRNAGTAQETLAEAEGVREAVATRASSDAFKGIVGAADDETVTNIIGSIFNRTDAVPRARELMSRLTTPEAQDGARRAVVDYIRNRFVSNAPALEADNMIRAEQFQNFMKDRTKIAALRQVLSADQVAAMQAVAADIRRMNRSVQTKIRGSSNTLQDTVNMQAQRGRLSTIVGAIATAAFDAALIHMGVPWPVATTGRALKGVYQARKAAKQVEHFSTLEQLVDRAMLDPQFANDLLNKATPPMVQRTPKGWKVLGYQAGVGGHEDKRKRGPRQAGGGVPAIGGTGGRSPRATTPAGAGTTRQGAGQALSDGGAAGDQEADQRPQPASRERFGAALTGAGSLTGSPAGGGEMTGGVFKTKAKGPAALLRQDVVDQLRRHGIDDKEVLAGWTEGWPRTADSRAEGGAVERSDERQGFMPPEEGRSGNWPIGMPRRGQMDTVAGEMQDQTAAAQQPSAAWLLHYNPKAVENFIANAPRSTNIEDRTRQPPADVSGGGYSPSAGPSEDLSDSSLARALGYGAVERHAHRVPLPRSRPKHGMADGGEVEPEGEEKLPLPGESIGLGSRPRVPLPTNKAGETLPGSILKAWGEGLKTLPERATHAAGELQRQGDVYDPGPALETAGWMLGARTPFMNQPGLGVFGGRGAKTANLEMLKRAEEMHATGAAPESIWNQTGWAQGPDGKWRFEIPDQASFVKPTEHIHAPDYHVTAASKPSGYRAGALEDVIHHPEYFEAYPQFKDMPASMELQAGIEKGGGYLPPDRIGLPGDVGSIQARAPHTEGGRDVLLHEMQHAIQEAEGFGPGANPNQLPYTQRQMMELTKNYADLKGVDWKKLTPAQRALAEKQMRYEMYTMYAGETEARNVQTRADFENRQTPPWKTEDVPREFQLVPASEQARAGIPVKGRKPYMLEERPEGVRAPGIVRSEFDRPLFDYSRMEAVPNVPQFGLPRIIPARGVPEHILRLGDPRNMERTNAIVQMGMSHGGPEWYNTMPLRDRYIGEVGATKGPESHRSFINYTGATSPRSPVPLNVSVASYYDMLAAQGRPFPQPVFRGGNWSMPRGQLPEGYGSLAQATNARNAQMIREQGGWPSWTHFEKPKPPSFTSNLLGNYQPVTSDVHNVSMLNLRGPQGNRLIMPPHPYYGYIEQLQQGPMGAGQFINLAPAQYQASGWIPWAAGYRDVGRYGDVTGGSPKKLEAYSQPFIKVVEDRVKNKARELGWSPEQTLRAFLRKEIAIVGVPAAAIPLLQDHLQRADQGGT